MMSRTFTVLFVFLALLSCGKKSSASKASSKKISPALEAENSAPSVAFLSTLAQSFSIHPRMVNFSEAQKEKVKTAAKLIKKVVASREFREAILNYTFQGKKQFVDNRGLSNEKIYQMILEGSEMQLREGKNNVMDLELQLYHEDTTTIGYTYPDVLRIYMNTKYFDRFTAVQVSDNMMHEWLHKIGFDHDVQYSPTRDHSVPYAIGYIVKRLARNYLTQDSVVLAE